MATVSRAAPVRKEEMGAYSSDTAPRSTAKPPWASLYVGDLDPSVTEEDLAQAFERFGSLFSVRVCRDFATGASLRYAYLNFLSHVHAENALKTMNHVRLNGSPIRIMWSQRNPLPRKTGVGNLYVKNLDGWVGGLELESMFVAYGTVVSCKVARDDYGKSKGFGFVQMDSEAAAQLAIKTLHSKTCRSGSKKLYVSKFVKKSERQVQPEEPKCCNLYIKNLDSDITEDLLRDKFSKFGKVSSAVVMHNQLGKSRGFGFVSFELLEHAMMAMESMNGSQLGSKRVYVRRAQKKAEREEMLRKQFAEQHALTMKETQGSSVYVKNLDDSIDERKLQEHFAGCGKIVSTKVMRDADGLSRGFGFLCFSSTEEAKKAVATLNGTILCDKGLHVAIAKRKENHLYGLKPHPSKTLPVQHPTYHGYSSGICSYSFGQFQDRPYLDQQYGMGHSAWKQDLHFVPSLMFPSQWRSLAPANSNHVNKVDSAFQMGHPLHTAYLLPFTSYVQPTRNGRCRRYHGAPRSYDSVRRLKKAYYSQFDVANICSAGPCIQQEAVISQMQREHCKEAVRA